MMSRVGHTHGHVDQIFGLISSSMKFIDVLADGEDVAQKIEAVLHRIGVRKWIGNDATIRCQFITGTRPWKEWLAATHANFSGGLKTDETGLHSFIFMRREDVPPSVSIAEPGWVEQRRADCIIMVKRHAADDELAQEPMLALPASFLGRMQSIPQEARILPAVKPAKRKDYLAVARIFGIL